MVPPRSMTLPFAVVALWGLVLASSARAQPDARQPSGTGPQEQTASRSFPGSLPAAFVGDLPCADCPGVRHTVVLHPDQAFIYRMTYLERGEGGKGADFDDVGRWSLSADGRTLTLAGGREQPAMFAVQSADTLRKRDVSGRPIQSALNYDLTRAAGAEAVEPKLLLRGMYSYMADAGVFAECLTGWRLPVAAEADNVALERGYLAAARNPGEPVLVTVEGRVAMRPPMEGTGLRRSLVPLRFVAARPGERCEPGRSGAEMPPLDGTSWQLTSASIPVALAGDPARVTLKFTSGRISASSGCNMGTGSYSLEGNALATGPLAATRMACPPALAAWEDAFFEFLAARPAASLEGDELVLVSAGGSLRFRPVPVPSANAVQKFVYVAAERKPCSGVGRMECLQVRDRPSDPWQLYYGEIVGFTHVPGTEYRLRIWEDDVPKPPADGSSKRWLLDLVVEQRVIEKQGR